MEECMEFEKAISILENHGHTVNCIGNGFVQLIDNGTCKPYHTIHIKDGIVKDENEKLTLKEWLGY